MSLTQTFKNFLGGFPLPFRSRFSCTYELVGDLGQCADNNDGAISSLSFYQLTDAADGGCILDRGAAKFHHHEVRSPIHGFFISYRQVAHLGRSFHVHRRFEAIKNPPAIYFWRWV